MLAKNVVLGLNIFFWPQEIMSNSETLIWNLKCPYDFPFPSLWIKSKSVKWVCRDCCPHISHSHLLLTLTISQAPCQWRGPPRAGWQELPSLNGLQTPTPTPQAMSVLLLQSHSQPSPPALCPRRLPHMGRALVSPAGWLLTGTPADETEGAEWDLVLWGCWVSQLKL